MKSLHSPLKPPQMPELLRQRSRFSLLAFMMTAGWLASSFTLQAYAADMSIGNGGMRFNRDTTIESDFVESHGAYQSTFGVVNLDTNEKTPLLVETKPADNPDTIFRPSSKISDLESERDFRGTPGNAVPKSRAKYTFKANTNYAFYLESTYNGRPTGTVYSSDVLNPEKERQATFSGGPLTMCQGGGMTVAWDDTGSKLVRNRELEDRDLDDYVVRLRDTACPIGGGEAPPVAGAVPPAPVVGQLPPAVPGGGAAFPLLPVLGGAGLIGGIAALAGGGDDDGGNGAPGGGGGGGGAPPAEPIPEPLTILGSGTAVGFVAMMQRRRKKNRKKD